MRCVCAMVKVVSVVVGVLVGGLVVGERGALGQVGLASQSRQIVVAHPDGTLVQSAPTFGVWNQLVIVGNTAGGENSVDAQSNVSESTIRMSANVTTWAGGNATNFDPIAVNVSVSFNIFSEATVNIAASDTMGSFASAGFSLTGPGVGVSGRTVSQTRTLGPGAYTLTYTFTKLGSTLPASGSFSFALDFVSFQPGPTAVTYQGKIKDSTGTPASGAYDVGFMVYSDAVGGTPLQFGITRSNVPVVDGVITTDFDFESSVWQSSANRWLEVAVKQSGTPDPFTVLSPRQRIGPTPRAMYADSAGFTETANTAFGLDAFSRVQLRGEAGASSNSPGLIFATPVNAPVARGFVGMADSNNLGLYGYAGAGWGLTMRTDTGRVGVGTLNPGAQLEVAGAVRATGYQYPTLQLRSKMIGYTEFRCRGAASPAINNINLGVAGPDGSNTSLIATVTVPAGAQLSEITVYYRDADATGSMSFASYIYNMDVPNLSVLTQPLNINAAQGTPLTRLISVPGGAPTTSDTVILLEVTPINGLWSSANLMTIQAVKISYFVGGPN